MFVESPPRPEIYVAFEKTVDGDSSKSPYERGEDRNGNSQVSLVNGARVGVSSGRSGKALLIQGTNAGATMGYFQGHPIKYVPLSQVLNLFDYYYRVAIEWKLNCNILMKILSTANFQSTNLII